MKKILTILFLFLSSFCFASCTNTNTTAVTDEEILQAGYDYVTLPTKVTEDFELPSYYSYERGEIEFYYVSYNTDVIKINRTPRSQKTSSENALTMACITRSNQDVEVLINCYIKFSDKADGKSFYVTVVGLENYLPESSTQDVEYINHF